MKSNHQPTQKLLFKYFMGCAQLKSRNHKNYFYNNSNNNKQQQVNNNKRQQQQQQTATTTTTIQKLVLRWLEIKIIFWVW